MALKCFIAKRILTADEVGAAGPQPHGARPSWAQQLKAAWDATSFSKSCLAAKAFLHVAPAGVLAEKYTARCAAVHIRVGRARHSVRAVGRLSRCKRLATFGDDQRTDLPAMKGSRLAAARCQCACAGLGHAVLTQMALAVTPKSAAPGQLNPPMALKFMARRGRARSAHADPGIWDHAAARRDQARTRRAQGIRGL
jgi:hypothetical protein